MTHNVFLVYKGQVVLAIQKSTEEEADQTLNDLANCVVPETGVSIAYSNDPEFLLDVLEKHGYLKEERNPLVT